MDLVCIDLDNTLIDSDKPHILGYLNAFKKNNLPYKSPKEIKKYFGLVSSEIIKNLYPKISKNKLNKVLEDNYNYFYKHRHQLKAFKGIKKTLKILSKKYTLALISNCPKKQVLDSVKKTKINLKLFKLVIGCDQVKKPKPYPDEILLAEKILNKKAKFVIGDSPYDIIAGKKAHTKTIAVLTGNHSKKDLKKTNPDFIFSNFNQVLKVLK
ncbi:MAG: HAD family hydrolase [Nanoarchaeota archaeon]